MNKRKEEGQSTAATAELANAEFSIPTTEQKIDTFRRSKGSNLEQASIDIPMGGSTGLDHTDLGRIAQ